MSCDVMLKQAYTCT